MTPTYNNQASPLGQAVSHLRSDVYEDKLPSPPPVAVPVPKIFDGPRSARASSPSTIYHLGRLSGDVEGHDLRPLSRHFRTDGNDADWAQRGQLNLLEWHYDHRHRAHEMLPFLYLGPVRTATDAEFLAEAGVTMVLCVRWVPPRLSASMVLPLTGAVNAARRLGVEVGTVEAADNAALIAAFPEAVRAIAAHLCQDDNNNDNTSHDASHDASLSESSTAYRNRKVLVFCETGNGRAAAVVVAFLMHAFEGLDHLRAMQFVAAQRFCVCLDDGLRYTLQAYHDILEARRGVARGSGSGGGGGSGGDMNGLSVGVGHSSGYVTGVTGVTERKRSFADTCDAMDVDEKGVAPEPDAARFEDRTFAPFEDAGAFSNP